MSTPQLELLSGFRSADFRFHFGNYFVHRYFQTSYSLSTQYNGTDKVIREADELLLYVEVFVLPHFHLFLPPLRKYPICRRNENEQNPTRASLFFSNGAETHRLEALHTVAGRRLTVNDTDLLAISDIEKPVLTAPLGKDASTICYV
ncbi:hypothetical protein X777_10935 [Ooceraea biroi]|uniref:Uncharacterized protein n=1 Tax=Ooceraea biroi TaxID=2015173 RepID=A0A026W6B3_OOCBI|nr:hypothetical protein X777_10935 [Ooceraea biroi]